MSFALLKRLEIHNLREACTHFTFNWSWSEGHLSLPCIQFGNRRSVERMWEGVSTSFRAPFTGIIKTFKQCVLAKLYNVFELIFRTLRPTKTRSFVGQCWELPDMTDFLTDIRIFLNIFFKIFFIIVTGNTFHIYINFKFC